MMISDASCRKQTRSNPLRHRGLGPSSSFLALTGERPSNAPNSADVSCLTTST